MKKLNIIYQKKDIIYPTNFGKYINIILMSQFYSGIDKIRATFNPNYAIEISKDYLCLCLRGV